MDSDSSVGNHPLTQDSNELPTKSKLCIHSTTKSIEDTNHPNPKIKTQKKNLHKRNNQSQENPKKQKRFPRGDMTMTHPHKKSLKSNKQLKLNTNLQGKKH